MFRPPSAFIRSSEARQAVIKQRKQSDTTSNNGNTEDDTAPPPPNNQEEQQIIEQEVEDNIPSSSVSNFPNISNTVATTVQSPNFNLKKSKTHQEIERIKNEREDRRKKQAELRKLKDGLTDNERQNFNYKIMIQRFRDAMNINSDSGDTEEDNGHGKTNQNGSGGDVGEGGRNIWMGENGELDGEILKIVVRKRPQDKKEIDNGLFDILSVNKGTLYVHEPKAALDLTQSVDNHKFEFDRAYDEKSANEQIYTECVSSMADSFLSGNASCTFIAYGQTGSGKTHTVFGNKKDEGVIVMLLRKLLEASTSSKQALSIAFYEIYANKIHDLLQNRKEIRLLEVKNGCVLQGLKEIVCSKLSECMRLLDVGMSGRITAATEANAQSSRSHAILQLKLVNRPGVKSSKSSIASTGSRQNISSINPPKQPVFAIVDLAGSEKASETNLRDKTTMMEGAEINKSLLALKECIRALNSSRSNPKVHIPFRSSKLTMVLRDSLDIASTMNNVLFQNMVLMTATVRPTNDVSEHTLNTLRYAHRLKETRAVGNVATITIDKLQISDPLELIQQQHQQQQAASQASSPISKQRQNKRVQPPSPANNDHNDDQSPPAQPQKSPKKTRQPKQQQPQPKSPPSLQKPQQKQQQQPNPSSNSPETTDDICTSESVVAIERLMRIHLTALGQLLEISQTREEKWLGMSNIKAQDGPHYLNDLQVSINEKMKILSTLQLYLDQFRREAQEQADRELGEGGNDDGMQIDNNSELVGESEFIGHQNG